MRSKGQCRACQRLMDAVNMPMKTLSTALRFSASASRRCLSAANICYIQPHCGDIDDDQDRKPFGRVDAAWASEIHCIIYACSRGEGPSRHGKGGN